MDIRYLGRIGFDEALALQNDLAEQIRRGAAPDTALLLEHDPVYTIGRTRNRTSLGADSARLPAPVVEINRGGQATYHGPGQIVGYVLLDLTRAVGRDLHRYLRLLEDIIIQYLAGCGIEASRRENLTGVWAGDRKVAAIGVGVRRWVTMHGFALNITDDSLPPFLAITPCGIDGVQVTSIESELRRLGTNAAGVTVAAAASGIEPVIRRALEAAAPR